MMVRRAWTPAKCGSVTKDNFCVSCLSQSNIRGLWGSGYFASIIIGFLLVYDCFWLPIILLTRCTFGKILQMWIGFKRSVRPGEWISKFYDAYDLIPVESESWVNLRRRDSDPIMYKPSGGCLGESGLGGGERTPLSNRQRAGRYQHLTVVSVSSILCVSDLTWESWWCLAPPPCVKKARQKRHRERRQVWVTIMAVYSPLPAPSVSTVTNQRPLVYWALEKL